MMVHASCVVIAQCGVLLRGAPASGKSDLVLRLIERGMAELIGDDQICLNKHADPLTDHPADYLTASAPEKLKGLLHITHIGLTPYPVRDEARLGLVVDLCTEAARATLPLIAPPQWVEIEGVSVPLIMLCAYDASAPEKICVAVRHLTKTGFADESGILR